MTDNFSRGRAPGARRHPSRIEHQGRRVLSRA